MTALPASPPAPPVCPQGPVTSLKRHKADVEEVGAGTECGVVLAEGRLSDFQPGDVLECVERVQRKAPGPGAAAGGSGESGH